MSKLHVERKENAIAIKKLKRMIKEKDEEIQILHNHVRQL